MLLLQAQSKVSILTFGGDYIVSAHIKQAHITETATSMDDLLSMLRRDANTAQKLGPTVEVLDSDRIEKNHQVRRVIPSVALGTHLEPIPPMCAVVVLSFVKLNEQVTQALSQISGYDVARLLVCRRDDDIKACLAVINQGKAEGALSLQSSNASDLAATIALLKMRKALQKQSLVAELVGYGRTSFIKDTSVMEFVTAKAASLGAVELRLNLDPPGVLMIGHDLSPAFLMICDETYAQGLREIARDCSTSGFHKPAFATSLADLAKNVRVISDAGRWFYCELPYENIPHQIM